MEFLTAEGAEGTEEEMISFPVASELLTEIRRRQCRVPTINRGRDTALPSPLYHSGATGIDMRGIDISDVQGFYLSAEFDFVC